MNRLVCLTAIAVAAGAGQAAFGQAYLPGEESMPKWGSDVPFNGASFGVSGLSQRAVPAARADIMPGRRILDNRGYFIGRVSAVEANAVVVQYAGRSARLPLHAFGKSSETLVLPMTRRQFVAIAARGPRVS